MHSLSRNEFRAMLRLAAPIVLAEIGWMTMALVDTMMTGRVSAQAMGAAGIGGMWFYTIAIVGSGVMLGLDALVSQAFGAGDVADCRRSLVNAVYLSLLLAPVLMGAVWAGIPFLGAFGINPSVMREAAPFLRAIGWSTWPLLLYFAFRRYLQGMNLVKPVMLALVTANAVNAAVNWVLVFGNWGARAMGAEGSAWATCISRAYLAAALLAYIVYHDRRTGRALPRISWRPDFARMGRLMALGFPAGMQLFFEVAVFGAVTFLIGRMDAASLAGHQIALNAASFTYMVPLGIASAAAVRVGQALGRADFPAAARAGWTAVLLGGGFMSCAALVFLLMPGIVVRAYTTNREAMKMGIELLQVAAFFQLFDGLQGVVTGALRGAGDTRTPMLCHLLAYWLLGLPLGYFLAFQWEWGAAGLWAGLCVALILIGSVLLLVWHRAAAGFAVNARILRRSPDFGAKNPD